MKYSLQIKSYLDALGQTINNLDLYQLNEFIEVLRDARESGKNIFIFGNGGSGTTASHFACDFNKTASYQKQKRFKMICLNDNIPIILAYANDVSYNDIFVEQLRNLLKPDDIVIGISTSGNSENVIRAIKYANKIGANTVGLSGFDGGLLGQEAKIVVNVPIDKVGIIEDVHMIVDHLSSTILCKYPSEIPVVKHSMRPKGQISNRDEII